MLVKFSCNVHGDITMFGDVAERLLKIMGHSGGIPGAIYAKDIPSVIKRLQNAIDVEPFVSLEKPESDDNEKQAEVPVSLANRVFPLIEILKAAAEADCNVMWRKG